MGVFTQSVPRGLREKLYEINWALVLLIILIGMIGVGMLYSVEGGQWDPYASRHAVRFAAGFAVMLTVALAPPRLWMGLAYPAYLGALILLVGVEFSARSPWAPSAGLKSARSGCNRRKS